MLFVVVFLMLGILWFLLMLDLGFYGEADFSLSFRFLSGLKSLQLVPKMI